MAEKDSSEGRMTEEEKQECRLDQLDEQEKENAGDYMAEQRYKDAEFAERAAMCQDCAEGNEHQCELPANLIYDGQAIQDARNEIVSTLTPGSGKTEKVLVVDKTSAAMKAAVNAAQNLSVISQMAGGPSIEELLSRIIKKPSGKKQTRSGGPVLTGKRLEKLKKSMGKHK